MSFISVIRTKTYYCGRVKQTRKAKYVEVDMFPYIETETGRRSRKRKEKVSRPVQAKLNHKNAKRYFGLLLKSNFGAGDLHVTLTYSDKNLPDTPEAAEQEVKNYLRRISRLRKKQGLMPLKYIYVTEQSKTGRIHHHIVMNGGLDRDAVELLWKKGRGKQAEQLGHVNADRLRIDEQSMDALVAYLSKDPRGRKRWCPSRNLEKPEVSTSDTKTSKKKFYKLTVLPEDCEEVRGYFEKIYTGYKLTECTKIYNEITNSWMVRVKMTYQRC